MGRKGQKVAGKQPSRLRVYTAGIAIILVALVLMSSRFMIPWVNDLTAQPRVCTVESAELNSSSGGPRSATKREVVYTYTSDCGMVYISRLRGSEFKSFEELEQWLNERQGQQVTFWVGKIPMSIDSTRAERVDK